MGSFRSDRWILMPALAWMLWAYSMGGWVNAASPPKEIPFLYVETTPAVSFDPGDRLTVKVRMTKEDGTTALPGRKVTLAINGENAFRQTVVTGSDGWGMAIFSLANNLESSCCVLGKRDYANPYSLIVTFPGDSSYARQEVIAMVGMRGSTGQKTRIEYSPPRTVISNGKLQITNASAKLANGGRVIGNVQVCVDKYCSDFSSAPSVDVSKLPRGSYAAILFYGGDATNHHSAAYASLGVFVNNNISPQKPPLRGLYKAWDWENSKPEDLRDRDGRPMSFDGTHWAYWKNFIPATQAIARKIRETPIKITLPDGTKRYKRFIMGISPIRFGDPPTDEAPAGLQYKRIPIPSCGSSEYFMPDYTDPAWQQAYRDQLLTIADWWKNHPEYQDIIVAIRVGGGYDGEWPNGPTKHGCARADFEKKYGSYENFMRFWDELRVKAIRWCSEASARSQVADGKKLHFILEDNPHPLGRTIEPAVGYRWNGVDVYGMQIYMPPICAAPCLEGGVGYYPRIFRNHFGGLETRSGNFGYGQWPHQPAGARAAGGYWNSLMALESGADFFGFHGNYWHTYQYLSGFDLFMQRHLNHSCDGVEDGFIAFRESAVPYRKEAPACGSKTIPSCPVGSPNFNDSGITMAYGDIDICLYAPRGDGVRFEPVRNDYFPGEVNGPGYGQKTYVKAKAQHYINAGDGSAFHSRRLVSQYAYLDIDEGITSRAGSHWEIRVVYYDGHPGETDTFSVDYYSTDGSLKSLIVKKQGTEVFKEAVWVVNDLLTENPFKEASADLRLNNRNDGPDIFHSVSARAIAGVKDGAPIPPQGFSVTLGN